MAQQVYGVNAGHGRKKIQEAVTQQIEELDYSPPFQFGHPKQFELANRLAEIFPEGMNHVFLTLAPRPWIVL